RHNERVVGKGVLRPLLAFTNNLKAVGKLTGSLPHRATLAGPTLGTDASEQTAGGTVLRVTTDRNLDAKLAIGGGFRHIGLGVVRPLGVDVGTQHPEGGLEIRFVEPGDRIDTAERPDDLSPFRQGHEGPAGSLE